MSLKTTLILTLTLAAGFAQAQEPTPSADNHPYAGAYLGFEVGRQNVFGGAFLDGLDVLAEDGTGVAGLYGGWRWALSPDWVLGIEGQVGFVDGDLSLTTGPVSIEYDNDAQLAVGLTLGRTLGQQRRWLIYGYALATERDFDIRIRTPVGQFAQEDRQGFWRWGMGVETRLSDDWHLRGTLGTSSVDFSGRTNIDIDGEVDVMVGVLRRF